MAIEAFSAPGLCSKIASVEKVVVFRALNLGDMLCAVPALRALRYGLPKARISLLGLPWARGFAARFRRYIDDFLEFPGYPGLPERSCAPEVLNSFLADVQKQNYDLAIQMHGSGLISNEVVAALGARLTAGFFPLGGTAPDPELYAPYPAARSEVERNLLLVRHLGFRDFGDQIEFPIRGDDSRDLSFAKGLRELRPGTYVCIHPGASVREKCWPVENFGAIGLFLRRLGFTVVVTGNAGESDLAAGISAIMNGMCIDAASLDLSLGSLALLIRGARLLFCNDTGISHLAAALAVPSVVVFTRTDPDRWAPLERVRHRVVGGNGSLPSVEEVMNVAQALLR